MARVLDRCTPRPIAAQPTARLAFAACFLTAVLCAGVAKEFPRPAPGTGGTLPLLALLVFLCVRLVVNRNGARRTP
ncbi:hypothetical protein [Saccharothrix lopnurensis]|uniref:MYXO-CTERM domain-containing protein n=1 Tax=Saccharothrix lopnurensis TaxID=1670621 RepID=A0ABW1PEA4_9PSEU